VSAGIQFVDSLVDSANVGDDNLPDLVTVVDFDSSARVVYPLGDPAGAAFDGIDSSGGTFIAGGITLSLEELTRDADPAATKDRTGIVVLTDGQDSDISALVAAVNQAAQLGIRVSFGFLAPPAIPISKARRSIPRRNMDGEYRSRPLYARQSSGSNPLSGTSPDVVAAILRTGGVFGTISSAEAQRRFVELVISRGPTNIDGIGSSNGGPLFPGVTIVALASTAGIAATPDIYTYRASPGEKLKFTAQTISGNMTLDVKLRDVRGGRDVGNVVADSTNGGVVTIPYEATAGTDLELLVVPSGSSLGMGGNSAALYSVTLEVASPPTDLCTIPHNSTCSSVGETRCCGTGFLTCDYNGFVYKPCGPGTTCKGDNGSGGVYCGWP
jgi:hypothetical protein